MDLDNQLDSDFAGAELSAEAKAYLLETAKWVKIIAGIGMTGVVLFVLFWVYEILSYGGPGENSWYLIESFLVGLFFCIVYLIPLQYSLHFRTYCI